MLGSTKFKLLIHSAAQIVKVACNGEITKTKRALRDIPILQATSDDGCSVVIDNDGKFAAIGMDSEIREAYSDRCEKVYDASNQSIIPGLVDGHTHTVWAGDRVHEFAMKLAGATYMDIHKAGGGIHFTVDASRKASEDELYELFKERMNQLLKSGVTLVECKSGYGVDFETELKLLRVINRGLSDPEVKNDISVTYCGAHSVGKGLTMAQATQDILENQIPRLRDLCEKGELHIDNIDVFCEKGVFELEETKAILEAGLAAGWKLNFHAEEFNCLNSVEMGADLNALAMSHLEEISEEGIKAMAEKGCVATILPTTAYLLHLKPPPVRKMIEEGVPVALGTDFNPNAYCLSMPFVMNLACVIFGMSMPEALSAATLNSAASLGKSSSHGSIEVGKLADLVILNSPSWEHLAYEMGSTEATIKHVVKSGEFVFSRE